MINVIDVYIIKFKDFREHSISVLIGIDHNIRGCAMEVPNDKAPPSIEIAKPPTQNWSKRKTLNCLTIKNH